MHDSHQHPDQKTHDETPAGDLVAFDCYRRSVGRSKTTFWRYRKSGWLHTVNILGRLYITRQAIQAFEAAAQRGELASEPTGCAAAQELASLAAKTGGRVP